MTTLPAAFSEAEMLETVNHWVDLVADMMTKEAGRLILRNQIKNYVRDGTIPVMNAITAAEAGHEDADVALRELAVEIIDRGEPLTTALGAYVQRALMRPPISYPPGRNIADTWMRDIGIAVMVMMVMERWQMSATRNPASKHPSACYVVAAALGRCGVLLGERRVEKIFGDHAKIAGKLSASMPTI